jgi:hypothetical protein
VIAGEAELGLQRTGDRGLAGWPPCARGRAIMPAPAVAWLTGSTRMKAPVSRLAS